MVSRPPGVTAVTVVGRSSRSTLHTHRDAQREGHEDVGISVAERPVDPCRRSAGTYLTAPPRRAVSVRDGARLEKALDRPISTRAPLCESDSRARNETHADLPQRRASCSALVNRYDGRDMPQRRFQMSILQPRRRCWRHAIASVSILCNACGAQHATPADQRNLSLGRR